MEHLDKLIPLAILGAVAGLLVFLLRRTIHHENVAPPVEAATQAIVEKPSPIEEPVAVSTSEPVVVAAAPATITTPQLAETPAHASVIVVETKVRKRKPKKALAPAVAAPASATPDVTVLDLLKNRHSLAAAFMLREILAPPVSKRK